MNILMRSVLSLSFDLHGHSGFERWSEPPFVSMINICTFYVSKLQIRNLYLGYYEIQQDTFELN